MTLPHVLRYGAAAEDIGAQAALGLPLVLEALAPQAPELDARLCGLMARFTCDNLVGIERQAFRRQVEDQIGRVDAAIEGYADDEVGRQRDLSVKFHWGHDHDFGDFKLTGRMGTRHLSLLRNFFTAFPVDERAFQGKRVLDIGCWTGGTTLILSALGAKVTSVEEVRKYANVARFLAGSFGVAAEVLDRSLYGLDFKEEFDVVYFPGVIYHVSDPLLALRLLYNSLAVGGCILVESEGINAQGSLCGYEGSVVYHSGSASELNRGGWNWFSPTPLALARMLWGAGFDEIELAWMDSRLYAFARKNARIGVTRAGLSRPDVP